MRGKTLLLVAAVAGGIVLAPSLAAGSAETPYGTHDGSLEGRRYRTLRALALHLDETARGALESAINEVRHGASAQARFLASIRSFAHGADALHCLTDDNSTLPFEAAAEVEDLAARARQVSDRIRSAGALESTYDDWEAILDVLERMRLLLAGGDVEVPAPHVVGVLSGSRLQEFRQLAHDVDSNATRAHETAQREVGDYKHRGQQFLGELHYFATQSRGLHSRADAGQVHPQQIGPAVNLLLEDARQADRSMRDARVFASVWVDSGRTITMLRRMASLVRSCEACERPSLPASVKQ
jgi:hypothetical protein